MENTATQTSRNGRSSHGVATGTVRVLLKRVKRKINNLEGKVSATDSVFGIERYQHDYETLVSEADEIQEKLYSAQRKIIEDAPGMSSSRIEEIKSKFDEVETALTRTRQAITKRGRTTIEALKDFCSQATDLVTTIGGLVSAGMKVRGYLKG